MRKRVLFSLLAVLFCLGNVNAQQWQSLNMPGAIQTHPLGIDGAKIVGSYEDASGWHGFLYEGDTWTTLDKPGAEDTYLTGIDGSKIVGNSGNSAFLYDGQIQTWTDIAVPGGMITSLYDIDGDKIVGTYHNINTGGNRGLVYDGVDFIFLDFGTDMETRVRGIDGDVLVGTFTGFYDGAINHPQSFYYDGSNMGILKYPGSSITNAYGIDSDYVIGSYSGAPGTGSHAFIKIGIGWYTIDMPDASFTRFNAIDGDTIVGYSSEGGFIYTIPEPATLMLLVFGVGLIRNRTRTL